MFLIVGLGNPGETYARHRHNVGFQCVKYLADRHGMRFLDKQHKARVASGTLAGQRVVLAKPFTFMNDSGQSVAALVRWHKIDPSRELLVIYDELDLPFGTLRMRPGGSAGGHNGMKSIIQQLGTQDFARLRVGIGRPPHGGESKTGCSTTGAAMRPRSCPRSTPASPKQPNGSSATACCWR